MDKKSNETYTTPRSSFDLSALMEPNKFDSFLNEFIEWVNEDLRCGESPKVKTLFVTERSWGMLRSTMNRAGCDATEELWKHTIVCPLYLFMTTQQGIHATAQQRVESLRYLLPVAEESTIDALAHFDSIFFFQAPAEFERMPIPTSSLAFVCLSLLEDFHNIPGALTPNVKKWWNGYSTTRQ